MSRRPYTLASRIFPVDNSGFRSLRRCDDVTMSEQWSASQGPATTTTGAAAPTLPRRTSRRVSGGAAVSAAFAAAGAADRRRSRLGSAGGTGGTGYGRRKSVSLCRFSVQEESERRQSQILAEAAAAAAAAAAADDNVDEAAEAQQQLPFPDYPVKAFFILEQTTIVRRWCLKAITWPYPFISSSL